MTCKLMKRLIEIECVEDLPYESIEQIKRLYVALITVFVVKNIQILKKKIVLTQDKSLLNYLFIGN